MLDPNIAHHMSVACFKLMSSLPVLIRWRKVLFNLLIYNLSAQQSCV